MTFTPAFLGALGSGLLTKYVPCANNCNLPVNKSSSVNWVHNAWTTHYSFEKDTTNIVLGFVNGLLGTNSELNADYDFDLTCGIYLPDLDIFYPAYVVGTNDREKRLVRTWGTGYWVVSGFVLPAGMRFMVTNRRVAADLGAAGSYNAIISTGSITARADGIISGTDINQDYTLGVGVAYGARTLPIASNKVTAGVLATSTSTVLLDNAYPRYNYTAAPNVSFWYGASGEGSLAAEVAGTGARANGVTSLGVFTAINVSNGGSGHDPAAPPRAYVGGAGTPATGFGTTTATYAPFVIMGQPVEEETKNVLLLGDSITIGYFSVDVSGDLKGGYGLHERAIQGYFGCHKFAQNGDSAVGWVLNKIKRLAIIDEAINMGYKPGKVVIALGTNDFLTSNASTVGTGLLINLESIGDEFRARGFEVYYATLPPCTTTESASNKFTTLAEQTPTLVGGATTNWEKDGRAEQHNAALLANAIPNDGIIDLAPLCRATGADSYRWRVDTYGGGTAFCNADTFGVLTSKVGIHPSSTIGIPYIAAHPFEHLSKLGYAIPASITSDQNYYFSDSTTITCDRN